jgi:hypothetical protein
VRITLSATDVERYLRWVAFRPKVEQCWLWQGDISQGYGRFYANGKQDQAHVILKEVVDGPCPSHLERDHLCHNADLDCPGGQECLHRRCVRPSHIEYVTKGENARRGRLREFARGCRRGHPWTPENVVLNPKTGKRQCRTCANAGVARYRLRKKAPGQ